jgi:positive regulator of sigma E activity
MLLLTRDQVSKYYETYLNSLAIMAIAVFFVFLFLFFSFIFRGEYLYTIVIAALMVMTIFGAIKLFQYARSFRAKPDH